MQRWTVRTVRNVVVQSALGKVLAVLLVLGLVLPSYASAVALARVRGVGK